MYFNNTQRYVTKDATIIARLTILYVVNKATAASIAYSIDLLKHNKTLNKCNKYIFIIYNLSAKESNLAFELIT